MAAMPPVHGLGDQPQKAGNSILRISRVWPLVTVWR